MAKQKKSWFGWLSFLKSKWTGLFAVLLLTAVAIPVTLALNQQSTDNQSHADYSCKESGGACMTLTLCRHLGLYCEYGHNCRAPYSFCALNQPPTPTPTSKPTPTPLPPPQGGGPGYPISIADIFAYCTNNHISHVQLSWWPTSSSVGGGNYYDIHYYYKSGCYGHGCSGDMYVWNNHSYNKVTANIPPSGENGFRFGLPLYIQVNFDVIIDPTHGYGQTIYGYPKVVKTAACR